MLEGIQRYLARIKRGDVQRSALQSWRRRRLPPDSTYTVVGPAFRRRPALIVADCDMHRLRTGGRRSLLNVLHDISAEIILTPDREPVRLTIESDDFQTAVERLGWLPPHWGVEVEGQTIHAVPHYVHTTGLELSDPALGVEVVACSELAVDEGAPTLDADGQTEWPIDLVYTWVDGDDPAWRVRRDLALTEAHRGANLSPSNHPNSVDDTRYINSDELLYSLRSVYQFANWVRRIYIVTDDQTPSWLRPEHPKVTLINHTDILPKSTFNSHAIESALHRIPGLSEHYLYLNDDVFFGRMAYPSDYFDEEGRAKFFPSKLTIPPTEVSAEDKPIIAAAKNGRDVFRERFNKEITHRIRHSVHAQRRSVNEQMEQELGSHFERLANTPFRSPRDLSIASSLHHWYGYELQKTVPAETNYLYLNITEKTSGQILDALQSLRRYDVFCLNQEETRSHSASSRRVLTEFLEAYFPAPAPWERQLGKSADGA